MVHDMKNNKKIGIMGGTFNPIHNGHIALAQAAFEYCEMDEVWFMPSGVSYLKKQDNVVSGEHRLEMTRLAIEGYPCFTYSDIEVCRGGNTYTVDTLQVLHERYPEYTFYFIMGADSLFSLPKWRDSGVIAQLCTLVAVVRDDVDIHKLQSQKSLLERTLNAHVMLVPFCKIVISSTDIREKLRKREKVDDMIPIKVLEYIYRNGLYMEDSYHGRA